MSLALDDVITTLRQQILRGEYEPGTKLREVSVSAKLGVSRTLSRLAMSALEHEGLLTRAPNRGSRVRTFGIGEIADAIEVRGELEAMAVRLAAEQGLSQQVHDRLRSAIARSEELLADGVSTDEARQNWIELNETIHTALISAASNWALATAIDQMSSLPLVSARAIIFDRHDLERGLRQLASAHADHVAIVEAVRTRQGHRAEGLMREHAYRNAQNKRANLSNPKTMALARQLPGGWLIAPGTEAGEAL